MPKQTQTDDFDYSIIGKGSITAVGNQMKYCLKGKMPTSISSLSEEIIQHFLRNPTTQKFPVIVFMHTHQEIHMNMDSSIINLSATWGRIKISHQDSIFTQLLNSSKGVHDSHNKRSPHQKDNVKKANKEDSM